MLLSCGNERCDLATSRLFNLKEEEPLDSFQTVHGWLKPAFGNLQLFAIEEGLKKIDLADMVYYFGGRHHIEYMIRKAERSDLGILMGREAGLVLDVLLPIVDGKYINDDLVLEFSEYVTSNPKTNGIALFHRGLLVKAKVHESVIESILEDQRKSAEFMAAAHRLKSPITLPANFISAMKGGE
jgi:hypothetical protein